MREYDKIETLYKRDVEGTKKLIPGDFRNETVEFLKNLEWMWTEKVDGTNIRIHWDGHKVEFGGRTDKAQIPVALVNVLNMYFGGEKNAQLFEQLFGEKEVIFFGEGYGAKIQNGGAYTDGNRVDFIMFDVMIGGNYLPREAVQELASTFGVDTVPLVGIGTLEEAVEYVKGHPYSKLGSLSHEMEGVVCRPLYELRDRAGNRMIVKIKWEDFKDVALHSDT